MSVVQKDYRHMKFLGLADDAIVNVRIASVSTGFGLRVASSRKNVVSTPVGFTGNAILIRVRALHRVGQTCTLHDSLTAVDGVHLLLRELLCSEILHSFHSVNFLKFRVY